MADLTQRVAVVWGCRRQQHRVTEEKQDAAHRLCQRHVQPGLVGGVVLLDKVIGQIGVLKILKRQQPISKLADNLLGTQTVVVLVVRIILAQHGRRFRSTLARTAKHPLRGAEKPQGNASFGLEVDVIPLAGLGLHVGNDIFR